MSSDIALRIENLTKRYAIQHKDHDHITLAQAALHRLRHPRAPQRREEFWALRDVSFEVRQGQVLGVIGHNGAGKSTLLKILSRITPPTSGQIQAFGRIGSLLEVGTGFHPELTGRENIYLNGSILGMRRREIDRQFDAIIDFSGVERFLDTPVKRYSSGMYVRLAFSVAAHLDTEILLLDEVLAVGDPDFQQRSVTQIRNMARDGRTVLFVSHNRELVEELTTTAIAFERGSVVDIGATSDVLERQYKRKTRAAVFSRRSLPGPTHLRAADARADRSSEGFVAVAFDVEVTSDTGCYGWRANFTIRSPGGASVGATSGPVHSAVDAGSTARSALQCQPLPLAPGVYSVDVSIAVQTTPSDSSVEVVDIVSDAMTFVVPELQEGAWDEQWGFLNLPPAAVTNYETLEPTLDVT